MISSVKSGNVALAKAPPRARAPVGRHHAATPTVMAKTKQQLADEKQAMWETQQKILQDRRSGKYMEAVRERKRKAREEKERAARQRREGPPSGEAMWSRQQQILRDRRAGKDVKEGVDKRRAQYSSKRK